MSAKTKIVVLRMKEVIYTAVFAALGICLIILLIFMFLKGKDKEDIADTPYESTASAANYIAGVYTTSVVLRNQIISVEVIVDKDHINSIRLIHTDDTVTTMFPLFEPTMAELATQIIDSQSLENITYLEDSKYTSLVLIEAVKNALSKATVTK